MSSSPSSPNPGGAPGRAAAGGSDENEHAGEQEHDHDDSHGRHDPRRHFNFTEHPRSRCLVETDTSELQSDTELECSPFLQDLATLPRRQIRHLREVGLLPPAPAPEPAPTPPGSSGADDDGGGEGGTAAGGVVGGGGAGGGGGASSPPDDGGGRLFDVVLLRSKHAAYLNRAIGPHRHPLPPGFVALDSSRTWMAYWTLHGCDLLDRLPGHDSLHRIVDTVGRCFTEIGNGGAKIEVEVDAAGTGSGCGGDDGDGDGNNNTERRVVSVEAGGYGGGPGQMGHTATTYAAVLALCIVAGSSPRHDRTPDGPVPTSISDSAMDALESVRRKLYAWFYSLRCTAAVVVPAGPGAGACASSDGDGEGEGDGVFSWRGRKARRRKITGFRVHHDGEVDVRGTYTVATVCSLLNLLTPELTENVAEYVASCQTHEGGYSGAPFEGEAHGGYTYCAVAALRLLGRMDLCDRDALRGWLARRQLSYEGGFNGRTNKLVDGCYSFWQGGAMAVLNLSDSEDGYGEGDPLASGVTEPILELSVADGGGGDESEGAVDVDEVHRADGDDPTAGSLLFHQGMLQRYILLCAQEVDGGLRDKPSKPRDFYHTCYNLSGLSVSQHVLSEGGVPVVHGCGSKNVLRPTHPTVNVHVDKVGRVVAAFRERHGVPRHRELLLPPSEEEDP